MSAAITSAPTVRGHHAPRIAIQADPVEAGPGTADTVLAGEFRLNGESHFLGATIDWRSNPSQDIEWLILLNKFYYAPALTLAFAHSGDRRYLERFTALLGSWIAQDLPAGFIAADVTGRRIQNWCLGFLGAFTGPVAPQFASEFLCAFHDSLEAQTGWLRDHLHPVRNHRTLELYSLLLCGLAFPCFARAAEWRQFALRELEANALADFRTDGGHREQSTHYHCIALRNHLLALQLALDNGLAYGAHARSRLHKAAQFAARMHMPDGRIAPFSDSDRSSYLETLRLAAGQFSDETLGFIATAGANGTPPESANSCFPDSGYVVQRSPWREDGRLFSHARQLILDCGPLGEGNHGHFDLLSFEAHAWGRALVVDPGRYTYDEQGPINWRAAFRGTAAHSTIEVDALDQVRYEPGPKRMKVRGPAPRQALLRICSTAGQSYAHAKCTSPQYAVTHHRRILLVDDLFWIIADDLLADEPHTYRSRLQLAPDTTTRPIETCDPRQTAVSTESLQLLFASDSDHSVIVEQGQVSPRYGVRSAAPRICVTAFAKSLRLVTLLLPGPAPALFPRRHALVRLAADRFSLSIAADAASHYRVTVPPLRTSASLCAMHWARETGNGCEAAR